MLYDINETHDPNLKSWVASANDRATDFPIQNLPFCRFVTDGQFGRNLSLRAGQDAHLGIVIGDQIIDLFELSRSDLIRDASIQPYWGFIADRLNVLASGDPEYMTVSKIRLALQKLLIADNPLLRDDRHWRDRILRPLATSQLVCPFDVWNYTDFYASVHHATTVGAMFRPDNPLLPNYKWVPIGYHGRASSIVPSGEDHWSRRDDLVHHAEFITRPRGQTKADDAAAPSFAPCKMLDYEMEVGFFVGRGNDLGTPIPIDQAEDHIFGLCLVNDWSARDMQKWEYQPLGPFLAKNFATSVSPYVVTMEALAPYRCPAMKRPDGDPAPLPHLFSERDQKLGGIDITLEVFLASKQMRDHGLSPTRLSKGSFKDMYWTIAQLLTHHASNGCNMQPGDLLATGTISGPTPESRGCLLELTWDGPGKPRKPIELPTGEKRTFLEDGDEVIMKGYCEREGFRRIGFGECRGIIAPPGSAR